MRTVVATGLRPDYLLPASCARPWTPRQNAPGTRAAAMRERTIRTCTAAARYGRTDAAGDWRGSGPGSGNGYKNE
jgi:hypothetical protein